jgi:protein farnesyltransferase/geranylgeranyltransferase type-1 subunit alpha
LTFVEQMIQEDARNNSAWNYRWFLLHHQHHEEEGRGATHTLTPAQAIQETDFVVASIGKDSYNESSWRYLVAILREQVSALLDAVVSCRFVDMVLERINDLQSEGLLRSGNPHYMGAMVDILEIKGDRTSLNDAQAMCLDLSEKFDAVRAAFWDKRQRAIVLKLEPLTT